jgi:hypothetical protein
MTGQQYDISGLAKPELHLTARQLALTARIAECAYFKAQNRGFAPGNELHDWLTAEQECIQTTQLAYALIVL